MLGIFECLRLKLAKDFTNSGQYRYIVVHKLTIQNYILRHMHIHSQNYTCIYNLPTIPITFVIFTSQMLGIFPSTACKKVKH